MAEYKGIDVSSNNGDIDWTQVGSDVTFAILRIHQRFGIDERFEQNYKGCKSNGILVGGYKYSYALTKAQAIEEAEDVLAVLAGRGLDFPIFYDLEWELQQMLNKSEITDIAIAFLERVKRSGYKVGIYCSDDWFKNILDVKNLQYDFWIASTPSDDQGQLLERLRPSAGVGWQYSWMGTVSGVKGKLDMNVFYTDYRTRLKGEKMTKSEAINKVISIAKAENGYLEKRSNSQLDSKTANAGSENYTKYWRDIYPAYQGQPWCACFVTWCFVQAFGKDKAKQLLKHYPYTYCPTMKDLFTLNSNPNVGDIVIFYRNGQFAHTGIVTKVSGDQFWTVEGNTSGGSTIVANGGGVFEKSYYNSKLPGTKFCTPDYSLVASTSRTTNTDDVVAKKQSTVAYVARMKKDSKCYTKSNTSSQSKLFPKLKKGAVVDVMKYTETDSSGLKWYFVRIPYPNDDGFVFEFVPKGVFTRISEIS